MSDGTEPQRVGDKGLKAGALGYASNLVIGVASTAPAYSLAVTLGFIVVVRGVGVHAPAVLIVSFVPILFVALGYRYLNRADPDAGASFAWTTRAFGPWVGWINGWAIFVADVIVMASLAVIASSYTYLLFGWNSAATSKLWILVGSVIWIALMTWISYRGIELSARTQVFLLAAECLILAAFAIVALAKTYSGSPVGSLHVSASWFNPFDLSFTALVLGVLLGIFIYWGWDSGVNVNEESENPAENPGKAAVVSTLLLVLIYVIVATAAQAFAGTKYLGAHSDDVLSVLGHSVFGSPWDKLLIVAVLTSASASTQTTILPTARTTLSMAKWGAIPALFGRVHPRYLTPSVSTIGMGAISTIWTVALVAFNYPASNILNDSITGLGFAILFYYGFTGFACAWYFRRQLFKSVRGFVLVGLLPLLGGLLMAAVFVKAFIEDSKQANAYSNPVFGIQMPILIGIGALLLGVPVMILCAVRLRPFFRRRPEVAPPGIVD